MSTRNDSTTTGDSDAEQKLLEEIFEESAASGDEDPDTHSVRDPSQEAPARRVNLSTKEALKYLRDTPGVKARREDGKWVLSVAWEGEEVFTYETNNFNEALQVTERRAAPIAECLQLLGQASGLVEDYAVRSLWPVVSEYARSRPQNAREGSWVFVGEDTREILHISGGGSGGGRRLGDAIEHFRSSVQREDPIEIWRADPHWKKQAAHLGEKKPQVGDTLDDIPTSVLTRVFNRDSAEDTSTEVPSAGEGPGDGEAH